MARVKNIIPNSILGPRKKNSIPHEIDPIVVKVLIKAFLLPVKSAMDENKGEKMAIIRKANASAHEYKAVLITFAPKKLTVYSGLNLVT